MLAGCCAAPSNSVLFGLYASLHLLLLSLHTGQLGLRIVLRIGELDVSLLRVSRKYRQSCEEVAWIIDHTSVSDVIGTRRLCPNVVFSEDLVVGLHGGKQAYQPVDRGRLLKNELSSPSEAGVKWLLVGGRSFPHFGGHDLGQLVARRRSHTVADFDVVTARQPIASAANDALHELCCHDGILEFGCVDLVAK